MSEFGSDRCRTTQYSTIKNRERKCRETRVWSEVTGCQTCQVSEVSGFTVCMNKISNTSFTYIYCSGISFIPIYSLDNGIASAAI